MDTTSGDLFDPRKKEEKLRRLLKKQEAEGRQLVEFFEVGERVKVKGGWFVITAIKTHKRQRLVLKPIPSEDTTG